MIVIIMGVSGSGKTTIGKHLEKAMNSVFFDADDYHSDNNKIKMKKGVPLNQKDRDPWLKSLRLLIDKYLTDQKNMILACSALSHKSRSILGIRRKEVQLVYLKGPKELIKKRIEKRHHFMPLSLLDSQFLELSQPTNAIVLDINLKPNQLVAQICDRLKLSK